MIQSHAQAVCQYFEENDNSSNLFGANTIIAYGQTCKTKISLNVYSGAYALAEQLPERAMHVDPDRLVITLI